MATMSIHNSILYRSLTFFCQIQPAIPINKRIAITSPAIAPPLIPCFALDPAVSSSPSAPALVELGLAVALSNEARTRLVPEGGGGILDPDPVVLAELAMVREEVSKGE
jgi:hypothetical protein